MVRFSRRSPHEGRRGTSHRAAIFRLKISAIFLISRLRRVAPRKWASPTVGALTFFESRVILLCVGVAIADAVLSRFATVSPSRPHGPPFPTRPCWRRAREARCNVANECQIVPPRVRPKSQQERDFRRETGRIPAPPLSGGRHPINCTRHLKTKPRLRRLGKS